MGKLLEPLLQSPTQPVELDLLPLDFDGSRVVVVIPAYNEERFIGSVLLKLRAYPVTIIVVDDGSSDGTALIARAAGAEVIRHACNQGKGAALNTGLRAARLLEPDVLVLIDADGQHLPEQLPRLVGPVLSGQADLVVGSRYLLPSEGVPRHRVWGHRFFNSLTRLVSHSAALYYWRYIFICSCNLSTDTVIINNTFAIVPRKARDIGKGDEEIIANP